MQIKRIIYLFKLFFKQHFKMKILLFMSFICLGIMRLLILIIPFKHLVTHMGKEMQESTNILSEKSQIKAVWVSWAVNVMSKYTPWESKCYVRALTAMFILKILRIPSTLYLGVSKNQSNSLIAHAWLRSGKEYITGGNEISNFKCISYFSSH